MTGHFLSPHVRSFFSERPVSQLGSGGHTVSNHSDSFRLLPDFAEKETGRCPTDLTVEDIDAGLVGRFLDHLETERGNGARTRNARLTAIQSFFSHLSRCEPALLDQCRQLLAIPAKRHVQEMIEYLDGTEIEALVAAPDVCTRQGRRDRTILLLMIRTGIRVSEPADLNCDDVGLGNGAHVRVRGKGRRQRTPPLREDAAALLREWLQERQGDDLQPLFPSNRNRRPGRDTVVWIVGKHVRTASETCPSLRGKRISPHSPGHTTAMAFLRESVPITVIALWLGHQSVESTMKYVHADPKLKEDAMEKTRPVGVPPGRFRPSDRLMDCLDDPAMPKSSNGSSTVQGVQTGFSA